MQGNRFERHSTTVLVLFVIVVVFVSDFVFTGLYHIQKYGTIHKYADRRALRIQSPVFHHTLKANGQQQEQKWGHLTSPIYTNSLGFKDKKVRHIPLDSPNYRLLFIGDSFTEGIGFAYEKTFVGLMDQALSSQHVEVLNAAVSSYSPTIYFKKIEYLLETVGLDVDHLIVFLDISDIEDEVKRYELRGDRVISLMSKTSKLKEFVFEYTGLIMIICSMVINVQKTMVPMHEYLGTDEERRYGINQPKSLWTVNEQLYQDYGQRGLRKAQQMMEMLYQLLQRHRITLTIAVYPWPDQIIHRDLHSRQVTVWQEWARTHSVAFFNFFPLFLSPESDQKETLKEYFIEGDVHWNKRGHALIADALLEEIRREVPEIVDNAEFPKNIN